MWGVARVHYQRQQPGNPGPMAFTDVYFFTEEIDALRFANTISGARAIRIEPDLSLERLWTRGTVDG